MSRLPRRAGSGLVGLAAACILTAGLTAPAGAVGPGGAGHRPSDDEDDERLTKVAVVLHPLDGWRIALDPGHNGGNGADREAISQPVADGRGGTRDCNTVGTSTASGYAEHELVLDVGTALAAELEDLGATVLLTRDDDAGVGPCVDVRGRFAEDADADLMLSLHANGSVSPEVRGFFVIVSDPAISPSQEAPSVALAQDVVDAFTEAGLEPSTSIDGAISERDDLATLNFARRPAVLVELGEMRNPDDAALMESEEGREGYVTALSTALLDWTQDRRPRDREPR